MDGSREAQGLWIASARGKGAPPSQKRFWDPIPAHHRYGGPMDGSRYEQLTRATAALDPPFAVVDLDAYDANGRDLLRRAAGTPIRLASKSIRCRELLERTLASDPGYRGTLAFTLPEALWLAEHGMRDLLVAYPTTDAGALRRLAARAEDAAITLMVDDVAHLDLIDRALGANRSERPIRLCIEADAGWWPLGGRIRLGVKRSPLHMPEQVTALARTIARRPQFRLVGLMAYEAQIAGVGDRPPGNPAMGVALRAIQRASARELARPARRDRRRGDGDRTVGVRQRRRHRQLRDAPRPSGP